MGKSHKNWVNPIKIPGIQGACELRRLFLLRSDEAMERTEERMERRVSPSRLWVEPGDSVCASWHGASGDIWWWWMKNQEMLTKYGYESIPINTIFRGMNIHKSQLFWCELQYKVLTHCHIWNGDEMVMKLGSIHWVLKNDGFPDKLGRKRIETRRVSPQNQTQVFF